MTSADGAALRLGMVQALRAGGALTSERIAEAFAAIPRERFLGHLAMEIPLASIYEPQAALVTRTNRLGAPISSSSAPEVMAPMLEALDIRPGQRVMEIGTGTGYNAALLSELVGRHGCVVSVEIDAGIAHEAEHSLAAGGHAVRVVVADGEDGLSSEPPFDRMIVTASVSTIPPAWHAQLVEGGILVVPLRLHDSHQIIVALCKQGPAFQSTRIILGGFMPLRGPSAGGEAVPDPALSIYAQQDGRPFLFLAGPQVERLSDRSRRQLLSTILSVDPRDGGTFSRLDADALHLFLGCHRNRRLVRCAVGEDFGIGTVDSLGQGFSALLVGKQDGRIQSWGDLAVEDDLRRLMAEWLQLGSPGPRALQVSVIPAGLLGPTGVWRSLERGDQRIVLRWAAPHDEPDPDNPAGFSPR